MRDSRNGSASAADLIGWLRTYVDEATARGHASQCTITIRLERDGLLISGKGWYSGLEDARVVPWESVLSRAGDVMRAIDAVADRAGSR